MNYDQVNPECSCPKSVKSVANKMVVLKKFQFSAEERGVLFLRVFFQVILFMPEFCMN